MIKAQDLRIGNLVFCDGKAREVLNVGISGVGMRLEYGGLLVLIKYEEIQPIPLTPELLEKIGFKEGKYPIEGMEVYFKVYSDSEVKVVVEPDGDPYYRTDIGQPIRYLHQLQNLYYSLTGQELNIQL